MRIRLQVVHGAVSVESSVEVDKSVTEVGSSVTGLEDKVRVMTCDVV